jgi:hypothetical protein
MKEEGELESLRDGSSTTGSALDDSSEDIPPAGNEISTTDDLVLPARQPTDVRDPSPPAPPSLLAVAAVRDTQVR